MGGWRRLASSPRPRPQADVDDAAGVLRRLVRQCPAVFIGARVFALLGYELVEGPRRRPDPRGRPRQLRPARARARRE